MCILGTNVDNFHVIFESLPGIVTSYQDNLLITKVCNNLQLIAANFIKIYTTDRLDYVENPVVGNKGVQVKTAL